MIKRSARAELTPFHYAWVIVSIAASMQMVGSGLRMAFGVVVDPLVDTFGWSHGSVALAYASTSIVTAVFSPIAGLLGNRFGARRTMVAGIVLFATGMVGSARVSSLWELHLWYGVVLGAAQALFLVPTVPTVAVWFRRHLGLGTGVLMLSWGIGPAIAVQVMSVLIREMGWSDAFLLTGLIGTGLMAGMMLLFRNSPEEAGRRAYGWRPSDAPIATTGKTPPARTRLFQMHIQRTNAFWNLIAIHFLGCVGHAVILVAIVPMAIHEGLSPITAAGVLSTLSGVSLVSRLAAPIIGDRIGSKGVMLLSFLGQGLTVLLLLDAHTTLAFYVFAVSFGLLYGGEGAVFPVINRQYYGQTPIGTTYGWQLFGAGFGMALGGALGGVTFDLTGGYTLAIVLSVSASVAGALCILLLEPTKRLIIPDWEDESETGDATVARAPRPVGADAPGGGD